MDLDTAPLLISDDEPTPASPASVAEATAAFGKYCEKSLHCPQHHEPPLSSSAEDTEIAEALRRSLNETDHQPDAGSPKKKARWDAPLAAEGTCLDMDSGRAAPLTPTEPFPAPDEEFHDAVAAEAPDDGQGHAFAAGLPADLRPGEPPAAGAHRVAAAPDADDDGDKTPTPNLDLRTLQSEILTMFGSLTTKIHEDNLTIMSKMNTLESNFQEKIDLNSKKLEKKIDMKHDQLSQNMTKKIKDVSDDMNTLKKRLEVLESERTAKPSPPSGSGPSRSAATAPSPSLAAADPVEPAVDPWQRYDFKSSAQKFGNLRKLDSADSSSSASATTFVPRFVHVQGWAKFGDENTNISQEEAKNLAAQVKERLPAAERALVLDVMASRLLNSRVSFRIKDGGENCWSVRRALDESFRANPILVKGIKVYPMVESPPAIKAKNRLLATATTTLMNAVTTDKHQNIVKDYRAATLYWTDNDAIDKSYTTIGMVKRDGITWKWAPEALCRSFPELDITILEKNFSAALTEE